jgi:hypothetical protein
MLIDNYKIYNFNPTVNHFYAGKNGLMVSYPTYSGVEFIDPTPPEEFDFLDNIEVGTLIMDSDKNFKYICADDLNNYVLSGSFVRDIPLAILSVTPLEDSDLNYKDKTFGVYHDPDEGKIIFVNKEFINIYDSDNFMACGKLFLTDRIRIQDVTIRTGINKWNLVDLDWDDADVLWNDGGYITTTSRLDLIKFGKNIRTSLSKDELSLVIHNKYSQDKIRVINLAQYGVGAIKDLDVRTVDDLIIILNKKDDGFYVMIVDISDISKTVNLKIESIKDIDSPYGIRFSELDSDLFYTFNKKEYQTRHISNPTYPTGRLETSNLLYYDPYKWNNAFELHTDLYVQWGFGITEENEYNNLTVTERIVNDSMYLLLHNKGRIYAMYQPLTSRYNNNVDINIPKQFTGVNCSESSIGPYINSSLANLINDTLNLYSKAYAVYNIKEFEIESEPLKEFDFGVNDLYINGNEAINAIAMQRILSTIEDVQLNLITPQTDS